MYLNSEITGTGSYIPKIVQKNSNFLDNDFLQSSGESMPYSNKVIIEKFKAITGIEERRYANKEFNSSDLGFFAAKKAIEDANIDQEEIDYIILAHNFGDVKNTSIQSDILPSLATRVKHRLQIKNPKCIAFDILFGCPGWNQGLIQADALIKSKMAKKILVIGSETLSRVLDNHDRDSMIYSDGAGACIIEAKNSDVKRGILGHAAQTDTFEEAYYLFFGNSFDKKEDPNTRYIKMHGHKIYQYALNNVPNAMKSALDNCGCTIDKVKKIFIHQANEKMDRVIISKFYKLFETEIPENIMPMTIDRLGNSSVATVPTLLDLALKGKIKNHKINNGDIILLAAVGAGMNINAIVYKI